MLRNRRRRELEDRMLGPTYTVAPEGAGLTKGNKGKPTWSPIMGSGMFVAYFFFSPTLAASSFPSFLPIPRICFPKPVCANVLSSHHGSSASDPITKLPVVCLYFVLFLFKVKKKGGWGGNLLKRIKLT